MKGKINSEKLQKFFLNHGEKIAAVLVVAVLVYGAYRFVDHQIYQKQPEELRNQATAARSKVDNAPFVKPPELENIVDPRGPIMKQVSIDGGIYDMSPFFPPLFSMAEKRRMPELLPVAELRVDDFRGALARATKRRRPRPGRGVAAPGDAMDDASAQPPADGGGAAGVGGAAGIDGAAGAGGRDAGRGRPGAAGRPGARRTRVPGVMPAADSKVEGWQAVIVTGVVPLVRQLEAYSKVFSTAEHRDPQLDTPRIVRFDVERALISSDDPAAELSWEAVDLKKATAFIDTWQENGAEVVPRDFRDAVTTWPLPPLVGRPFGSEATHPRFPIPADATPAAGEEESVVDEGGDPFAEDDEEDGGEDPAVEEDAAPAAGEDALDDMPAGDIDDAPLAGADPAAAGAAGAGVPGAGDIAGRGRGSRRRVTNDVLFRFFDFNVKPGQRYRYRVKLVLANPNYDVSARFLASPDDARAPTIDGPWSDPTPEIQVPLPNRVLAGPAKPAVGANEASITLMLVRWDKDTGVDAGKSFKMIRGQTARFLKETVRVRQVTGETVESEMDLEPGDMVVDIRGGDSLPGTTKIKSTEPGEVLLLDEQGRLVVRTDVVDQERFVVFANIENPPEGEDEGSDDFFRPGGANPADPAGAGPRFDEFGPPGAGAGGAAGARPGGAAGPGGNRQRPPRRD
jgi:hypothetical protein